MLDKDTIQANVQACQDGYAKVASSDVGVDEHRLRSELRSALTAGVDVTDSGRGRCAGDDRPTRSVVRGAFGAAGFETDEDRLDQRHLIGTGLAEPQLFGLEVEAEGLPDRQFAQVLPVRVRSHPGTSPVELHIGLERVAAQLIDRPQLSSALSAITRPAV